MYLHVFPILNPLPPPSHPIPQGHPSAPAPSTLPNASNLDWRSVSPMIIYITLETGTSAGPGLSAPERPVWPLRSLTRALAYPHWRVRPGPGGVCSPRGAGSARTLVSTLTGTGVGRGLPQPQPLPRKPLRIAGP